MSGAIIFIGIGLAVAVLFGVIVALVSMPQAANSRQRRAQWEADNKRFEADLAVAMMGDDPNPLTSAMGLSCIITNVEPGGATTILPCEPVYNVRDKVIVPAIAGGYETLEITDLADPFDTGTPYIMAGKRIINRDEIIAKVTQ